MTAPTMGVLQKTRYTHQDMVDFILANPDCSQKALAGRYGYTQSWVSNILASDAFQELLAARRKELLDPELAASLEERFRGLAIHSVKVLMDKLDNPAVEASVALRAAELGAKALGLGGHAPAPPAVSGDRLAELAQRLIALNPRTIQGEILSKETA